MKKQEINPTKARVKGNILANWEDVLSKTKFEDYHVSRQDLSNITWHNHSLKAIRLNAVAEKVTVTVTSDDASIFPNDETCTITVRVTYKKNNTATALPNHTVYLYDEDELIATMVTDENGRCTYDYGSYEQGTHTITARTPHMNGFEAGTGKTNVNIIYNVDIVLEPRTLYAGYGEVHQLKATMKTTDGVPVPNKPITFYEGIRTLTTINTDENGEAICNYTESGDIVAQTSIIADTVPDNLNWAQNNTITGHITSATGDLPVGEYVRLMCSKPTYAYVLANGLIQNDGTFTITYKPQVVQGNYEYYLVYRSVLNYDSINIVQTAGCFDNTQWTGSGSGGARYIDGQGLLVCEQQYSFLNWYGEGQTHITGDTWKYVVDIELNLASNTDSVCQIGNYNSIEGNTVIQYNNGNWFLKAWADGSQITNESIPPFATRDNPRNKVTFKRINNVLYISYKRIDTGETVTLTRTYEQTVPEKSRLMIYHNNSSSKIHLLEIERYTPLTLHETVNAFTLSSWIGNEGQSNSIGSDGELYFYRDNNYLTVYPENNTYLNGYKWRIVLDVSLVGLDTANIQQIGDNNLIEGHTMLRRENGVWKFLAWDSNDNNIKNQIIEDPVNETYPRNKITITRDTNTMTIQYKNPANNNKVTLSRTYDSSIAYDSRLQVISSVNSKWHLYDLLIEQYTRNNNYRLYEPTWTNIGTIPMLVNGEPVNDSSQNLD